MRVTTRIENAGWHVVYALEPAVDAAWPWIVVVSGTVTTIALICYGIAAVKGFFCG